MSDHIPTTKFIREAANVNGSIGVSYSEFDHWMEAHDREVAAKALRDAAKDIYLPSDGPAAYVDIAYAEQLASQYLRARADQIEEGARVGGVAYNAREKGRESGRENRSSLLPSRLRDDRG